MDGSSGTIKRAFKKVDKIFTTKPGGLYRSSSMSNHTRQSSELLQRRPGSNEFGRDTSLPVVTNQGSPTRQHYRTGSLRPLPSVPDPRGGIRKSELPMAPRPPRDIRARRPTGPRDLPDTLQHVIGKELMSNLLLRKCLTHILKLFLDNKARLAFIQTLKVEISQNLQELQDILALYSGCQDARLEIEIREKYNNVEQKMKAIEVLCVSSEY